MVLAITLLRRHNATVQVLACLIIIWLATVLQITFRPSRCVMLHTLQRASLYVLQCTLFLLMLSNLQEMQTTPKVVVATLAIAAILNAVLVIVFLYAFIIEARRLLLDVATSPAGQGQRWKAFLQKSVRVVCCIHPSEEQQQQELKGAGQLQQQRMGQGRAAGPPKEEWPKYGGPREGRLGGDQQV